MNEKTRLQTILCILSKTYPKAKIILSYNSPWELLVSVMLSAQCTDAVVNKVTDKLFLKYPTLNAYCRANLAEFEKAVKPTGFYHNKAKNILNAAKMIQSRFEGRVPKTMEELLILPGVARKTANVVLGNAYGVVVGIAVDTHVLRLSQRLRLIPIDKIGGKRIVFLANGSDGRLRGRLTNTHTRRPVERMSGLEKTYKDSSGKIVDFIKDASPEKIEAGLMKVIPKDRWFSLTYQLIEHGRTICKAKNPKCTSCPLASCCHVRR